MSDVADRADWRIEKDLEIARAYVKGLPVLVRDGYCHFCDEDVASGRLFCDADCRDDYDKGRSAATRAGRY